MKEVRQQDLYEKDSVKLDGFKCSCGGEDFSTSKLPNVYRCIACHKVIIDGQ